MEQQRMGIIDIGSNSIRLAIYERTPEGAYRVIDGSKQAGRLSEQIDGEGKLNEAAVDRLVGTLHRFRLLCFHHRTERIRAVATAAIRNAANCGDVLDRLAKETGMTVELLSGKEEAAYGFLGMLNTMDVQDGFLIDIGGGSTELSLFRSRELIRSVSFPFGAVNTSKRYADKGTLDDKSLAEFESVLRKAIEAEPWIREAAGLPLVGIGGTVRTLAKMHQAQIKYPLRQTHNYGMRPEDTEALFASLQELSLEKRKKTPGLSKDRADLIVPGIAILRTFFRACRADRYLICGAGLRDGLFFDSVLPSGGRLDDPLGYSIANIGALYPDAPQPHIEQVNRVASALYEALAPHYPIGGQAAACLRVASRLFRIGAGIDYYQYAKHTFYLMVNSHLNGISHRGILISAAVASYKNRSGARQLHQTYKPIMADDDLETVYRLGTLLQLAVALDRSESQPFTGLAADIRSNKLVLRPIGQNGPLTMERSEVEALADDFKKVWGLTPVLESTS
ncbi:phosphatase [Paenibacillus darwinianus]|uniref:Phosphatase n=1 Tax=Paenibacillus darwinianus TaxID=1380763 RepID=A0A9W5S1X3_9BACL|nr:Ppx/GppA phosphatase family protein [Paenibacillus darwinianus]EXX89391.1 phosphatase [Paenibacillus darwinianus]EXX91603.1 phosphatase [Paenibacillus darwinianus]EXX92464.1 phosphatase [Paenibacillus darwinianus]